MPELPDITVYLEALEARLLGHTLRRIQLASPFLLRSFAPPISTAEGRRVTALRRLGKRIAFGLDGDLWLVLHLMIAGRLHWLDTSPAAAKPRRAGPALATFTFDHGRLTLTEAGTKRRAALHLVADAAALAAHDPGGIDVFTCTEAGFSAALVTGNHTLKRALTDPRLFSGIGNAYSDEILHAARLSPVTLAARLTAAECSRLLAATREVLAGWTARLRAEAAGNFPEKVTAFHPRMAVHGRFGQPCPVCGTAIQHIVHAENEVNYCPRCQTGGKLLADRSLSRLLKSDWPRTIDEAESLGFRATAARAPAEPK